MDIVVFLACAFLLAIERLTYWWVWNYPDSFSTRVSGRPKCLGEGDPVEALKRLFLAFKGIQIAVMIGWSMWFAQTWLPWPTAPTPLLVAGLAVLLAGQVLNAAVFWRLGREGVFYGTRFGREIEWQTGFPFSLVPHPQYLGALISVWAFMMIMRFPNPDWWALPLLMTVYYTAGARVER